MRVPRITARRVAGEAGAGRGGRKEPGQ